MNLADLCNWMGSVWSTTIEHLIKYWSSTVNPVAVRALLLMSFYIAANKEYLTKRQIIFRYAESVFPQLYSLKFSFKSVDTSKSYARKQKGFFFETRCRPILHVAYINGNEIIAEFRCIKCCVPTARVCCDSPNPSWTTTELRKIVILTKTESACRYNSTEIV